MNKKHFLMIFFLLGIIMLFATVNAQFNVKLSQNEIQGAVRGNEMKVFATIFNEGDCNLDCQYKIPSIGLKEDRGMLSPHSQIDFPIRFQVPIGCPDFCDIPITFVCKETDCAQVTHEQQVNIKLTSLKSQKDVDGAIATNSQSVGTSTNEMKQPLQGQNKDIFRVEFFENKIDGLTAGSRNTVKATIFNQGQNTIKCAYKISGTDQDQLITEGLNPGAKSDFNLIFFVPKNCGEPCSVVSHVSCYDKQSTALLAESDVSFDLTGIRSKGDMVLGFVLLFIIVAVVIYTVLKIVKYFKRKRGDEKHESEEGRRKLSAIMFTDMKGYSMEMGRDEEQTLKKLWRYEKAMKSIIKEHDGRVVKTIGDAIMGDFDSAVNAVKAAIEIQNLLKKEDIQIRIGLHLGDVIHKGGDIFGDGVNIASRIESICEPGQIYISEDIYNQVKGKIHVEFENLGNRPLKNIESPPKVYKIK